MAETVLDKYRKDRQILAIRISSEQLGGIFRPATRIPSQTMGLVFYEDGRVRHIGPGVEVSGSFELRSAKKGAIPLQLGLSELQSLDKHTVQCTVILRVYLATEEPSLLRDFARNLFSYPGEFTTRDLENHIIPELKRSLTRLVGKMSAKELHRKDHSSAWTNALRSDLGKFLFGYGIGFEQISEATTISEGFEQAESIRKEKADKEVEETEALQKKEDRIRRFMNILQDKDVKKILETLPDKQMQGLIIAKLLEDDNVSINAEDLVRQAGTCGEEVVQAVFETMRELVGKGTTVGGDEVETEHAARLYLVAGTQVFEINPQQPEVVTHEFPEALRSVRFSENLLAGAKQAVYEKSSDGTIQVFPLPEKKRPRGGINAICTSENHLFATHSEFGLARWDRNLPGEEGELLFPEITDGKKTTRSVEVRDKHIIFASGDHVYRAPLTPEGVPVKFVSSAESPITCLAICERSLFAGTENGAIVGWKLESPDQPVILVRKKDPIVNVRLAKISGIPQLFYSTRDLSIRARVLGQNLETSYESGGTSVGALDTSSDFICATDTSGRKVFLWKSSTPGKPHHEIDIWTHARKPILDLWLHKETAGAH
ncbi:MAG: hypothetical protein QF645_06010 [Planctomycetota bacterium]|nr:hypothetical protein [Planctomycetota bacterium]